MAGSDNMQLSASLEDYLEAIYLVVQEKQAALPKDIRKILQVGRSSVSGALKVLLDRELINHESYGVITLTERGTELAREVVRRHGILKDFFIKVLAVDEQEADSNACRMEHAISNAVLDRFVEFVEFVENCPRGGSKWIKGFAYFCDNDKATGNCEKCIEYVLDDVREKKVIETEQDQTIQPSRKFMANDCIRYLPVFFFCPGDIVG